MNRIKNMCEMIKIDKEKNEIKSILDEVGKMRNSFPVDLVRITNLLDKDKLNEDEIMRDNEKYKILSKLSVDLYIDYEYYKVFSIKNRSPFENCAKELNRLGYELRDNDEWVSVRRPNIEGIVEQIFMSCLCQSICDNYSHFTNEKRILVEKCNNCGSNNEIIDDGLCGVCFFTRYNDWTCPYRFCEVINDGMDKYCKSCGIERSAVLVIGAPIWRCKNYIRDQVWICGICYIISEIDKDVVCCSCGTDMVTSSEIIKKQREYNTLNINNVLISDLNVDKTNNYELIDTINKSVCDNCFKLKVIVGERMCRDCFSVRNVDWICPYRFCRMTNISKDNYCKSCGIERSAVSVIGAPIWRCKNRIRDQVWICGKCEAIIEIHKVCNNCWVTMDKSLKSM